MGSISSPSTDDATIYTIDDLVRQLGSDHEQLPLVAFPRSERGVDDYEYISGQDINRFVNGAASRLLGLGLVPTRQISLRSIKFANVDQEDEAVVGIVSLSDLDFIVNVFALGRLGYTTLILSPRLDDAASLGLLVDLKTQALLYTPNFDQKATFVKDYGSLATYPVITRDHYDFVDTKPILLRTGLDGPSQSNKTCIIMHSSGSTGKPRHILYPHKRLLHVMVNAHDLTAFLSVPLYHAHGLVSFLQALFKRKTCWLFNGNVPQTHGTVTAAIKAAQAEIVWTVPYVLKLLAEKQDGIDVLRRCKIVSTGGSRTPDDLGNLVVGQGVHLGTSYGATEVAFVLSNLKRPRDDKAWDYMAAPPHVAPFIWMKPTEDGVYELVVLDGHKGKIMSNSNDPPNSFHTKDLFIPHSVLENRWKYVGRLDDRITLSNGEKFIPLDIEGRVRQSPLVKEAVVFGIDRPLPGLLIFKSEAARSLTDQELVETLWPIISECNARVSAFGQIGRDYVAILPETTDCPSTDKQSIKRAQAYQKFAGIIDQVYSDKTVSSKLLELDLPQLEDWLVQAFATEFGIILSTHEEDFFAAGVDSQKAIQMQRFIVRSLFLGESTDKVSSLVVFEYGNIARLSRFLHSLRLNENTPIRDEVDMMESYIQRFSQFQKFEPYTYTSSLPTHPTILLTGATGSLGSTILLDLISSKTNKILCPVRARSDEEAVHRLTTALQKAGMTSQTLPEAVVTFPCDLSISPLTIPQDINDVLHTGLTHIIHIAWPVNFSLGLTSFEPHLLSLHNLYTLTTSVKHPQPAQFLFCSSVGTAMSSPHGTVIQDTPIPSLNYAASTGYARSKLVAERILEFASSLNHNTKILRIGQIIPSTFPSSSKFWNRNETIPLIIQSVKHINYLPSTPGPNASDDCTWLPVNVISSTILDIANLSSSSISSSSPTTIIPKPHPEAEKEKKIHYNIVSPDPLSWTNDFLPLLENPLSFIPANQANNSSFSIIDFKTWFHHHLSVSPPDPIVNPSIKLLDIWSDTSPVIESDSNSDVDPKKGGGKDISFSTESTYIQSQTFRTMQWKKNVLDQGWIKDVLEGWGFSFPF